MSDPASTPRTEGARPNFPKVLWLPALLFGIVPIFAFVWGTGSTDHARLRAVVTFVAGWIGVRLGVWLLQGVLRRFGAIGGVAGVLVAETLRRRVATICAVLLLLSLAGLPFLVSSNQVLEYRLSSFLGYSLFVTIFFLSLLTMFGACGSLCEEIADRRIHMVVVKPVRRVEFLLGKWIGLVSLNLVYLAVAGGVIYGSFHSQLAGADRPDSLDAASREAAAEDLEDARGLLIARESIDPVAPESFVEEVKTRLDQLKVDQLDLWRSRVAALRGDELTAENEWRIELYKSRIADWRTVEPGETERYQFEIPQTGDRSAVLRLAPFFGRAHSTDRTRFILRVDGEERVEFLGGGESIEIPISRRLEPGELLTVEIESPDLAEDGARLASFRGEDTLTVEVARGTLLSNLIKGLLILAIELAFLAAVGLAGATFLGLPVAILTVGLVLFAAAGGGFFIEVDDWEGKAVPKGANRHGHSHAGDHQGAGGQHHHGFGENFMHALDATGRAFVRVFAAWGRYSPIDEVSSAREIPMRDVGSCLLTIGAGWTGISLLLGTIIFRRREIARVQV